MKTVGTGAAFASAGAFIDTFTAVDEFGSNTAAQNQAQRLDPLMVVLGTVWVPLAIGELNCQLRQFDAAVEGFSAVLAAQAGVDVRFRYLCEFIEVPFIRLLTLEALLGKADAREDGAALHAQNAHDTASEYFEFELQADEADSWSMLGSMFGGLVKIGEGLATGNPIDVASGALGFLGAVQGGGLAHRPFGEGEPVRPGHPRGRVDHLRPVRIP